MLRAGLHSFCCSRAEAAVIKAGTFCRTVVWPLVAPLMIYKYIRAADRDRLASELLARRAGGAAHSEEEEEKIVTAFFNPAMPGLTGDWRVQRDLAIIFRAANPRHSLPFRIANLL